MTPESQYPEDDEFQPSPPVDYPAAKGVLVSYMNQLEALHAMTNIAESLSQDVRDHIAAKVIESYNIDKDSRSDWERTMKDVLSYAKLLVEKKTYHGDPVSNIKYPIITNAAIQFAARAYPEIIKGTDVVKMKIVGDDPDGMKAERGQRLSEHMSYQLLNEMPEWEEGVDQLLYTLPVTGCVFKKTYYDLNEQHNVSEMVFPDDLVVNFFAKSVERATRLTHRIELTKNEIIERIRSGVFLDFDIETLGFPDNADNDSAYDEDSPHTFLEQHRWYDLDEDGYQEPYIVTVHKTTEKLVRVVARFELAGVKTNDKGEIVRIEPVHYFTRFLFMPAVDGSFYGAGFGGLLHGINSSTNAALNQLLDSGASANRPSGFLGRGVQIGKSRSLVLKRGEWKSVQSTGDDLRKNIVPAPSGQPSSTLFQLLGMLIESGKELSGMTEVLSGQSPGANVPATTTLALIEQGLQVYSGIQKRLHRSLYKEYQKIRQLNILYLSDAQYTTVLDNPEASMSIDYDDSGVDLIPVSDPNSTTNIQRIVKAKALLDMLGQGLNDYEIKKRYLTSLQVEDIEKILPDEEEQEPDPLEALEVRIKQAELQKVEAEAALIYEKINTERSTQGEKISKARNDADSVRIKKAEALAKIEDNERKDREGKGSTVKKPR